MTKIMIIKRLSERLAEKYRKSDPMITFPIIFVVIGLLVHFSGILGIFTPIRNEIYVSQDGVTTLGEQNHAIAATPMKDAP